MPRGKRPTLRDCRFDGIVAAVIQQGTGKPVTYTGITDPDRAADIRRGFYRCCQHRGISGWVQWAHSGTMTSKVADWPPDKQPDGTYTLILNITTKTAARKRHIQKYGTDRQNWPYNPRKKDIA
jgi:hypothetical protein